MYADCNPGHEPRSVAASVFKSLNQWHTLCEPQYKADFSFYVVVSLSLMANVCFLFVRFL